MADKAASSGASMLYVTCTSVNEAKSIAASLLGERLIACGNILPGMRALYWWQGEIAEDEETVLLLKTRADHVPAVIDRVRALHSDDVPCIVELQLARGNPAYLDWLAAEASGANAG
ncbi:MAG: divalent-cation tolerance protein CutA [Alphaproteobacteria bacterium]|jgi:periplasmic divalent cation tolerance protein